MALNDDQHSRVEISAAEYQNLKQMLKDGNRLGMYLRLHELSGSQAALDMAQICSSSGLRGGVAWVINEAYTKIVPVIQGRRGVFEGNRGRRSWLDSRSI